jgi:outer membrane protein TolC
MSLLHAAVVAVALGAAGQPRTIDVDEAVNLALAASPGLSASRFSAGAADSQAKSLRGRMLPAIGLSEEYQHYNEEFGIPLGGQRFVARNLDTNTFVAGVQQPLVGLLHLSQDYAALSSVAEAAQVKSLSAEEQVRQAVQTGYLRYFEARATGEIARASQQQLEERRGVVEAGLKAGIGTRADLLRTEVAIANVRQQIIASDSQQQVMRTSLLLALGVGEDVELVEPTALEQASAPALTDADAQSRAAKDRLEVERARLEQKAAQSQARAKWFALLPEANLEAAYIHVTGQVFAPPDSAYIGIKASWPIWEWGASWYQKEAAAQQAEAAAKGREETERQVKLDAASNLAQVKSAASAVDVAQAAIVSAEEAYRVTDALVRAGSATTTDLLDAQSALTQSKLSLVRARYERAVALVSLTHALGTPR